MNNKVLICDANHGGLTLLDEYSKYTHNDLYFYDIYNKLTDKEKEEYSKRYHVKFVSNSDIDETYISIAPIHMKRVIPINHTHHEFTSYLVSKHQKRHGWNFRFIQVTGVKGKTTTVNMIKSLLKDYNLLVLNSSSLSYHCPDNKIILDTTLSITPASIITSLNIADDKGLLDKIDYFIIEVSLGVIPNGYINVLTNILEDYPIADNKCSASIAKKSVFNSEIVLCDKKSYDKYYSQHDALTVSIDDNTSDFYLCDISYNFHTSSYTFCHDNETLKLESFAPSDYYLNNLLFSISIAKLIKVNNNSIISSLSNMNPIEGRTSYKEIDNKIIVEEINPGLNTTSIKKSIDNLERYYSSFIIILGGDYGITCEDIDEDRLLNYIKTINDKTIIFTGKLGLNLYEKLDKNSYLFMEDLYDAVSYSKDNYEDKVIEVIYRSEYGKSIFIKN